MYMLEICSFYVMAILDFLTLRLYTQASLITATTSNDAALNLFTPQKSQTIPIPNPVLKTLDAQKGTLLQASLQITDNTTTMLVPVMPPENWVRSSESSGPNFFSERIVVSRIFEKKKMDISIEIEKGESRGIMNSEETY
ncbi:hypothetical protein RYX36_035512 [Vicia faba]